MKIIDDKGRLFGKISLVDILVVMIVIVLGFAVYSRFFTQEQTAVGSVSNDEFTYVLRLNGVRSMTAEALRVGDAIYGTDNGTYLGTISNIEVKDSYQEFATVYGTTVVAPAENRYEVLLTIASEGLITSGKYYVSRSYELGANMTVGFYTKYCSTAGYVWSIEG